MAKIRKSIEWLVTGGNGQLGLIATDYLIENGVNHISFGSKSLDITNLDQVESIFKAYQPSVILNAAAWTNVDEAENHPVECFRVNAEGVFNLARIAREIGSTLIHISSDYVFSGDNRVPYEVGESMNPISYYGQSKVKGENYVREVYPEKSYILRTSWLYSKYGNNFAKTILRKSNMEDPSIMVVDDQKGSPTSCVDLVERIYEMVSVEVPYGTYHAANSGETSRYDYASMIYLLNGKDTKKIKPIATVKSANMAHRPSNSVLGQECWKETPLPAMQSWVTALERNFPSLVKSVSENEK